MKTAKYNYNKEQYSFIDSIEAPQTRIYKNNMIPGSQQNINRKKGNSFQIENHSYLKSASNQNTGHFYQQQSQQLSSGVMGISHHNASGRQRFTPYPFYKRSYAHAVMQPTNQRYFNYSTQADQMVPSSFANITNNQSSLALSATDTTYSSCNGQLAGLNCFSTNSIANATTNSVIANSTTFDVNAKQGVTLQISNLDTTIEENELKQYLINRLKPITTVLSIYFESLSVAKIKLPSDHQARQVIAYLHRKKIGHKRITVSYTRESSTLDSSTLRCQVAGLLKDIPNYKLSMYKFRELFQSRFKTSISVVDLHEMKDICSIVGNKNEEFITLRTELIDSIESSELMECFQHSVPYCTLHFVKTHRGWAEQEIDPLPNVQMTISQVRDIIFALLKNHKSVIPIASIVHCIHSDLNVTLERNESGVNFEHLISCIQGIQITSNKFSIKILSWSNCIESSSPKDSKDPTSDDIASSNRYLKYGNMSDSFAQISREIVELIKLSPKATLKFSRFIPAYHNHFGKQCRVADYGYTKLIDLFEALSLVVQVMGEGENRQITLTHRVQMQRFKTDLLRILRTQSTKSILLSHIPMLYEQVQGRKFNITDYGVCDIKDILDVLANTNVVVVNSIPHVMDTMISIPKRKQSTLEVEKTSHFAGEVVELLKHSSQYTILFEKFACSYHYHFGYQCRLSDYGFLKLADLMEAIAGIVEMEFSNDEDRKIFLSPKTAQRVFSEQLKELVESYSGSSDTVTNLHEILIYHKKHYGYQILPQSLGFDDMLTCIKSLPYIEVVTSNGPISIKCHHDDQYFRQKSYAAVRLILEDEQQVLPLSDFVQHFVTKYNDVIDEHTVDSMKHALEVQHVNNIKCVTVTKLMRFVVHLIDAIESHGMVKFHELANTIKISFKACFTFGYSNITSLMQAFPDIFLLTISKINNTRSEITINPQCILSKHGFDRYSNFIGDNNNDSDAINFNNDNNNKLGSIDNRSFMDSMYSIGAASLNLQKPVHNSFVSAIGTLETAGHHTFDSFTILTSMNSSKNDAELRYSVNMNSTNLPFNESYESFNVSQKSVEMNSNDASPKEDKENMSNNNYPGTRNIFRKDMSTFYDNYLSPMDDRMVSQRSFNGKDNGYKNKQTFYGEPPKPDTPPATPYWNNPIWGADVLSPPANVKIELPDLKVLNKAPILNSPLVMANIAKKNQFPSNSRA